MKTYEGRRTKEGTIVTVTHGDMSEPLPPRLDLWNHSPTGFEWSYGGSGPAQLSLALLADVLGDDEKAVELHQPFKWSVVAKLPPDGWQLTEEEINARASTLENG